MKRLPEPILIVNLSKMFGGAEKRVIDIAQALDGNYSYGVTTLEGSPLHQQLINAHLVAIPMKFRRCDPRLLVSHWHAIRKYGFKTVDAHNAQSQLWGLLAASLCDVPMRISTVHSSYNMSEGRIKGRIYGNVLKLNGLLKCRFIAVSESVVDYLRSMGINKDSISLIHNGISVPIKPIFESKNNLKNLFGWESDTFLVVVIGRLEPVKGHTYLIDALSQVVGQIPQIRCLIVGEGRLSHSLAEKVKKLHLQEYIRFTGFRRDIKNILKNSDGFCLASLTEGLPYALLEACSYGIPLLVTNVGGMAKVLTHNKTAILVPPADPTALGKGLIKLVENQEQNIHLAMAAHELAVECFSIEKMLHKSLCVYAGKA